MARLLEDLLDVSRISRNKLELRRERVELGHRRGRAWRSAARSSRPAATSSPSRCRPSRSTSRPTRCGWPRCSPTSSTTPPSTPSGPVTSRSRAERHGSDVVVSVKDRGIGISAETMPKIFEIFSQAQPALVRAQGGLGIGLSLVKGVVELHGGSVCAQSDGPGKGSEFVVRLPVAGDGAGRRPALPPAEDESNARRRPGAAS